MIAEQIASPFRKRWQARKRVRFALACVGLVTLAAVGVGAWLHTRPAARVAPRGMVYTAKGFGGYVLPRKTPAAPPTPFSQMIADYKAGHYDTVETEAQKLIRENKNATDSHRRQEGLTARLVLGYSAAWRKDYSLARERFAQLRDAAAATPDHGKRMVSLGENEPTFEEEGAFQHAVCTGALGDKQGAEAEYKRFVCNYPESILTSAALKRIAKSHGGDLPKDAEKVWREAGRIRKQRAQAREREESLCGPECLAELLRRRGEKASVPALASEMGTNHEGTSLLALAETAKKHGFPAQGLGLTQKGLQQQKLPLVALVSPGHYVLVEAVTPEKVSVWDGDLKGIGKAGRKDYPLSEWSKAWGGIALTVQ